jgi:CheY-like chemotaxis protein
VVARQSAWGEPNRLIAQGAQGDCAAGFVESCGDSGYRNRNLPFRNDRAKVWPMLVHDARTHAPVWQLARTNRIETWRTRGAESGGPMINVLFVDDEPAILNAFRRLLRFRGECNVEFVSSGQAALEMMDRTEFDAIVSDMKMPGMDGVQLLAEVMRRHPRTVRILLSGMVTTEDQARVGSAIDHCVAKPCDLDQLVVLIDEAVRSARAKTAASAPAIAAGNYEPSANQSGL